MVRNEGRPGRARVARMRRETVKGKLSNSRLARRLPVLARASPLALHVRVRVSCESKEGAKGKSGLTLWAAAAAARHDASRFRSTLTRRSPLVLCRPLPYSACRVLLPTVSCARSLPRVTSLSRPPLDRAFLSLAACATPLSHRLVSPCRAHTHDGHLVCRSSAHSPAQPCVNRSISPLAQPPSPRTRLIAPARGSSHFSLNYSR